MSEWSHWISWLLLAAGTFFFVAGTVGLLRFPDIYTRLHAVTKADTLGLGFIVLGLCVRAASWQPVLMMLLTWILIMAAGATACQLLARYAREDAGPVSRGGKRAASPDEQDEQKGAQE